MTRFYAALAVCVAGVFGALWSALGDVGVTLGFLVVAVAGFLAMSLEAGRVQRGRS